MTAISFRYADSPRTILLDYLQSFVGIKFKELGTTRAGVYCLGLVILFYGESNILLPDPTSMSPEAVIVHPLHDLFEKTGEAHYGCVVTMPGEGDFLLGHVGIHTPFGILHAWRPAEQVILEPHGRRRITGVYQLK